jgi:hypothetical protein
MPDPVVPGPATAAGTAWPRPVGFGAWDAREIGRPGLLRQDGTLWLFHAGCDVRFEWKLGAAVSTDGLAWERVADEPVLTPPATRVSGGGWHSYLDPSPVAEPDGSVRLYFAALGDRPGTVVASAVSSDLVDWSDPAVELSPEPSATGTVTDVRAPWAADGPDGRRSLWVARVETHGDGHRTSTLVRHVPEAAGERPGARWRPAGAPLVDPAGGEVDHPCAIPLAGGGWRLWCSSFRDGTWRILTATSPDGEAWSPLETALEGDPASPYETSGVFAAAVVRTADGYLMLHLASSRTSDGMSIATFARRSTDAVSWTRATERPVFHPRPGIPVRPW